MAKLFPPKSSIWAAGGVLARTRKGRREYLLVHRPRYNDWSLPKGKLDRKESFRAAAQREVEEETGRRAEVVARLGTIAYRTKRRNNKVVRYWLMEAAGGKFRPNREVDKIIWLPARKADRILSYNRDRQVLRWAHELSSRPKAGRVYLIRHGDAGSSDNWKKSDAKRPLSKRGRHQASGLVDMLTRVPITEIYSSDRKRCQQTVARLSSSIGLELNVTKSLREDVKPRDFQERIAGVQGDVCVICTHGEVISDYIEALASSGIKLKGGRKWQKGSVWSIDLHKGEATSALYTAPGT